MINIAGMKKAYVLLALYKAAKPKGIGELFTQTEMPLSAAAELAKNNPSLYFDYVNGRALKVDLSGDEFDPYLYDRDNGKGLAARVISRAMLKGIELWDIVSVINSHAYTLGLTELGLPEIIIFGLPIQTAQALLEDAALVMLKTENLSSP